MLPGDVIHIWLGKEHVGGQAAKFKYLICVDAKERRFLCINSEPRRVTPDENMPLSRTEAEFLPNDMSYIDTSRIIGLVYSDFRDGMGKPGAKEVGRLNERCKAKLLAATAKSKVLPKWQKEMIARNLGSGAPPPKKSTKG
jgi:hypothetical protein